MIGRGVESKSGSSVFLFEGAREIGKKPRRRCRSLGRNGVILVNQKGDRIGTERRDQRRCASERDDRILQEVKEREKGDREEGERETRTFSLRWVLAGEPKRGAACGPRFSYLSFPDAYVLLGRAMPCSAAVHDNAGKGWNH